MPARRPPSSASRKRDAFTLVELLAATAVFILLLGIILAVTDSVSATIRHATAGIEAQSASRTGFDLLNRNLSQATLNPYWDYDNPLAPTVYLRQSDLQFVIRQNTQNPAYGQEVYFVAPEAYSKDANLRSTRGLMNACSAFVQFGGSKPFQPAGISGEKFRYRLMVGQQPTEDLTVFAKPARTSGQTDAAYRSSVQDYWNQAAWLNAISNTTTSSQTSPVTPLIDNVIAFIVWPRLPSTEDPDGEQLTPDGTFSYNSQNNAMTTPQPITANQLPPVVDVTMVVISEASASRLDRGASTPPQEIEAALAGKFSRVKNYQTDLNALSKALSDKGIDFKIFSTAVPLRESRWSRAQ